MQFVLNGQPAVYEGDRGRRLSEVLRHDFGYAGIKPGCNAGDCGACTVMVDGRQFLACLMPVGQVAGALVVSVEGLPAYGRLSRIQKAFLKHGAMHCGFCTPGMLMAATDLLAENGRPGEAEVLEAIGGVLCRCTGYRRIVAAVMDPDANPALPAPPPVGQAVGARLGRLDGPAQVTGASRFAADGIPDGALWMRVLYSPHDAARFAFGDLAGWLVAHPGIRRVLTATDLPAGGAGAAAGAPPVLAAGTVRHRGVPVAALLGTRDILDMLDLSAFPLHCRPLPGAAGTPEGMVGEGKRGCFELRCGDPAAALARAEDAGPLSGHLVAGEFHAAAIAPAGIEPLAIWAVPSAGHVTVHVASRSPARDRQGIAQLLGLPEAQIRIRPTACGNPDAASPGLAAQALVALAARLSETPVALVLSQPDSMAAAAKAPELRIQARFVCDRDGRLAAAEVAVDFAAGTEPAVAAVLACGPYRIPDLASRAALPVTSPPAVRAACALPQLTIAHEVAMDDLALACGRDRLDMRFGNALRDGDRLPAGGQLAGAAGLAACLEALRSRWQTALARAAIANVQAQAATGAAAALRRGVGIACAWHTDPVGAEPAEAPRIRVALWPDGRLLFGGGGVAAGQGGGTALAQILADAAGLPVERFELAPMTEAEGGGADFRRSGEAGRAAAQAGRSLRSALLRLAGAGPQAVLLLEGAVLQVVEGGVVRRLDLAGLPVAEDGSLACGTGEAAGQGEAPAAFAFAAHLVELAVDIELGIVSLYRITAAHDLGRAINPQLLEGRIEGGIARGIGLALMEDYLPGRTDSLRDYLLPTAGDMPQIDVLPVGSADPAGPFGARPAGAAAGATAAAILGAIRHATGLRLTCLPALPHRILAGVRAGRPEGKGEGKGEG